MILVKGVPKEDSTPGGTVPVVSGYTTIIEGGIPTSRGPRATVSCNLGQSQRIAAGLCPAFLLRSRLLSSSISIAPRLRATLGQSPWVGWRLNCHDFDGDQKKSSRNELTCKLILRVPSENLT